MKYILILLYWLWCIIYFVIELTIKTICNLIIFMWDFRLTRKQYLTYKKIYLFYFNRNVLNVTELSFEVETYKEFFLIK